MHSSSTPLTSILICTRDRCRHLRETLASLAKVEVPPHLHAELVIVDNGSTDETPSLLRSLELPAIEVRPLSFPERGLARARNFSLRNARGEIMLMTDDDVRFPPDWIGRMCAPLLEGKAKIVAGGVVLPAHLHRDWMEPWHRAFLASTKPVPRAVGANMAFARDVLDVVPGFDEEIGAGALGYCEETFFTSQLQTAGFDVFPAFEVAVEHHVSPSRLSRNAYISMATRLGRTQAYIHHHWRHDLRVPPGAAAYATLLALKLKLAAKRLARWKEWRTKEGFASWENFYIRRIAYVRQGIIERGRPRNYEKHGLVKRALR